MNKRNYMKNEEGLRKVRTLIDEQKTVMMASNLNTIPFSVCPMTVQQMDEKGDLWFFVSKDSGLFKDIEEDNRVQIIYNDDNKQQYLSIFGNATTRYFQKIPVVTSMLKMWTGSTSKCKIPKLSTPMAV